MSYISANAMVLWYVLREERGQSWKEGIYPEHKEKVFGLSDVEWADYDKFIFMLWPDLSVAPGPAYGMTSRGAGVVHRLVEGEGELAGGPRGQG